MTLKQPTARNSKAATRQPRARKARPESGALTPREAWDLYDQQARELLGMSAEEFDAALEAGDFNGRIEERPVLKVWMIRTPRPDR